MCSTHVTWYPPDQNSQLRWKLLEIFLKLEQIVSAESCSDHHELPDQAQEQRCCVSNDLVPDRPVQHVLKHAQHPRSISPFALNRVTNPHLHNDNVEHNPQGKSHRQFAETCGYPLGKIRNLIIRT